jgi:hypothetical protein
MKTILTTPRAVIGVGLVAAVVAVGGYAFTATNTVPDSKAGYDTSAVSGYTISNIAYHLDGTDPTKSDYVEFDTDTQAGHVAAKPGAADTAYTVCTDTSSGAGTSWKCTWAASVVVADIDHLQVVAVQ